MPDNLKINNQEWLLNGNIDKDVYFLARNYDKEKIQSNYPQLVFIYEKNGYVFFVRHPSYPNNIHNDQK